MSWNWRAENAREFHESKGWKHQRTPEPWTPPWTEAPLSSILPPKKKPKKRRKKNRKPAPPDVLLFGMYRGRNFRDVPLDYLEWLATQKRPPAALLNYLQAVKAEAAAKREEYFRAKKEPTGGAPPGA